MKFSVLFAVLLTVATSTLGQASIVDVAEEADLTTLLAAVEYAGLGDALLALENGTVLAPTNDAFDNLLGLGTAGLNVTSLDDLPVDVVQQVASLQLVFVSLTGRLTIS